MDILVILLTRIGDLAQSGAFLKALKNQYPDSNVTLMCNEYVSQLGEKIKQIDHVIPIPWSSLKNAISNSNFDGDVLKSILSLGQKKYDLVYNLTYSRLGAALALLTVSKNGMIYGTAFNSDLSGTKANLFNELARNFLMTRSVSPLNIVEIIRLHLPLDSPIPSPFLDLRGRAPIIKEPGSIGIVMGAGSRKRHWPAHYMVELISLLLHEGLGPIYLLGGPKDSPTGDFIKKRLKTDLVLNLAGKIGLADLPYLLSSLNLVIGTDTGPLHLAAGLGTMTIGLFFGPAWALETGPFGTAQHAIQAMMPCAPCIESAQCKNFDCRLRITPKQVFELAKNMLHKDSQIQWDENVILESVRTRYTFQLREKIPFNGFAKVLTRQAVHRYLISKAFELPIIDIDSCIYLTQIHDDVYEEIVDAFYALKTKSYLMTNGNLLLKPWLNSILSLDYPDLKDKLIFALNELLGEYHAKVTF